jgi:hypothetical protein
MKMCCWCRTYKKKTEIKSTLLNQATCYTCGSIPQYARRDQRNRLLRIAILDVLEHHPEGMSAAEMSEIFRATNGSQVGSTARILANEGVIQHQPHPTEHHVHLWTRPPGLPKPKIGRPRKANRIDPVIAPQTEPEPDITPTPITPRAATTVSSIFNKLKRNPESTMKGITDDDLLWQARYRAQADWRRQQAMTA